MLKKLIVALLACLTIFLSKRALTESRAHSVPDRQANVETKSAAESSQQVAPPAPTSADRTAVLY